MATGTGPAEPGGTGRPEGRSSFVRKTALTYAGPAFLASHSTDVLGAMATSVLGSAPGKLLVLCVLTSTAASCQTTITPTARAALAMSAHGAIPRWFARMHPRFRTPTTATLVMGGISALFVMVVTARFLPRYFAEGITTPVRGEGSSTP